MYCPECKCEYQGWTTICPVCKSHLIEGYNPPSVEQADKLSYDELLNLVKENHGELQIELSTTGVRKERKWRFPYNGYGYAWASKISGTSDGISLNLTTSEVGKDHAWRFPYSGYGFAWAKSMAGELAGAEITLQATKVARERRWRFPYLGYGRAWTEEMTGECGDQLRVHLLVTEVGRARDWRFPYRGYGFAWGKKGILTLSLNQ
jgi:hypothetical protein